MRKYQADVRDWCLNCLGTSTADNTRERAYRFMEEALELFQSLGQDESDVKVLVDYVFNRPAGDPSQEVGGVMVTLAALCSAAKLDLGASADAELSRIQSPEMLAKIRAKRLNRVVPGDY